MLSRTDATFLNAPASDAPAAGKVAFVGVPFDALSTERGGSADAPAALRLASHGVGRYRVSTGEVVAWRERCVDLGDVTVNRFDPASSFEPVVDVVERCLAAEAVPLLVGGDHSLTYPAVTAAAQRHADLRLVQIDAHHDATDPARWRCRYNHGTFVRNLIDDGRLTGPRVFQLGIRDFQWHESGALFLRERAARVFPMHEIDRQGFARVFAELLTELREAPRQPTYVTFDIDSLDPAFAPGTGEHMGGGLSSREALHLVRELFDGSIHIVAADLVEVVPVLDPTGRTLALASQLLAQMAAGLTGAGRPHVASARHSEIT
ncbi:MAG: arginase family protein [Phycisphaeraceae bacterium]